MVDTYTACYKIAKKYENLVGSSFTVKGNEFLFTGITIFPANGMEEFNRKMQEEIKDHPIYSIFLEFIGNIGSFHSEIEKLFNDLGKSFDKN